MDMTQKFKCRLFRNVEALDAVSRAAQTQNIYLPVANLNDEGSFSAVETMDACKVG